MLGANAQSDLTVGLIMDAVDFARREIVGKLYAEEYIEELEAELEATKPPQPSN